MENRPLFFNYLLCWIIYVAAIHIVGRRRHLSAGRIIASHFVPSFVACLMTYIFVIRGGATVVQYVAGSDEGVAHWSLWVNWWPVLLFLTFVSGVVHFAWSIYSSVAKKERRWIPSAMASCAMSLFAFWTVMANFPDA